MNRTESQQILQSLTADQREAVAVFIETIPTFLAADANEHAIWQAARDVRCSNEST